MYVVIEIFYRFFCLAAPSLFKESEQDSEKSLAQEESVVSSSNVESFIQTCPLLRKKQHLCSDRRLSVSGRNELDNVILVEALLQYQRDRKNELRRGVSLKSMVTKVVKCG